MTAFSHVATNIPDKSHVQVDWFISISLYNCYDPISFWTASIDLSFSGRGGVTLKLNCFCVYRFSLDGFFNVWRVLLSD